MPPQQAGPAAHENHTPCAQIELALAQCAQHMAYTSVIPVRRLDRAVKYVMNKEKTTAVSLQDALDYAANRDKTEQSCFESSYACTLETAFADMRQTKERWHKSGGVQGYHLVQSFAAGEVTPELAHRIAKELADRVLGGRYEYAAGYAGDAGCDLQPRDSELEKGAQNVDFLRRVLQGETFCDLIGHRVNEIY